MSDVYKRVIGLDPGGTTGWATVSRTREPSDETWQFGQLGPNEHHEELFAFLEMSIVQETVIVCESFEFRQNRQRDNINLMSKEYIGVVKLLDQERNNVKTVFQTAAMAKGFVSDKKIKAMGLWQPGYKHAMDATRHAIYYLVNKENRTDLIKNWRTL